MKIPCARPSQGCSELRSSPPERSFDGADHSQDLGSALAPYFKKLREALHLEGLRLLPHEELVLLQLGLRVKTQAETA